MNDDANIAAEAARWAADDGLWTTQETVEANLIRFAQSVIKKATEQKDHEIEILRRDIDDKARVIESRAAHASEPWKYDIDGTDGYIRIHPMHNPEITLFWITELAQAKKCVNAHNQCRAAHASEEGNQ